MSLAVMSNDFAKHEFWRSISNREQVLLLLLINHIKRDQYKDITVDLGEVALALQYTRQLTLKTISQICYQLNKRTGYFSGEEVQPVSVQYNAGVVKASFNDALAPYLINLKSHFLKLNKEQLEILFQCKCALTIPLVLHILTDIKKNKFVNNPMYSLIEVRGILGIKSNAHDIMRYTMAPIIRELSKIEGINLTAGYYMEPAYVRKVEGIEFKLDIILTPEKEKNAPKKANKPNKALRKATASDSTATEENERIEANKEQLGVFNEPTKKETKRVEKEERRKLQAATLEACGIASNSAAMLARTYGGRVDIEVATNIFKAKYKDQKAKNPAGAMVDIFKKFDSYFAEYQDQIKAKEKKEEARKEAQAALLAMQKAEEERTKAIENEMRNHPSYKAGMEQGLTGIKLYRYVGEQMAREKRNRQ